ncbi:MAG TPA: chemotaxis protein CheA, partial [bacterium]|nr:chemotaxis protein CheA [bacterium]
SFGCVFITREPPNSVKERVADILEIAEVEVYEIPVEDDWYGYDDSSSQFSVEDARKKTGQQAEQIKRISSVRIDVQRLDRLMNLVEELAIAKLRIGEIADRLGEADLKASIDPLNRLVDDLQNEIMQARLVPVAQIFDRFPRVVRDLAMKESKKIRFEMIGGDIELDRAVLDEIADPLIHLIRNAVDHGIAKPEERKRNKKAEEGRVMLSAVREKNYVVISVSDDGEGVDISAVKMGAIERGLATEAQLSQMSDDEILMIIAMPGFSTARSVSEISGRGVGMDVVKNKAEMLGGTILIESKAHLGTKISMKIPITTAVVKSLIVGVEERFFAFPISSVVEIAPVTSLNIRSIENAETIVHRGEVIPLMRINEILSTKLSVADAPCEKSSKGYALIVDDGERKYAAMVDRLLNQQDIVIKQLSKEFKGVKGIAGATILGSGSIALVVDVLTLN